MTKKLIHIMYGLIRRAQDMFFKVLVVITTAFFFFVTVRIPYLDYFYKYFEQRVHSLDSGQIISINLSITFLTATLCISTIIFLVGILNNYTREQGNEDLVCMKLVNDIEVLADEARYQLRKIYIKKTKGLNTVRAEEKIKKQLSILASALKIQKLFLANSLMNSKKDALFLKSIRRKLSDYCEKYAADGFYEKTRSIVSGVENNITIVRPFYGKKLAETYKEMFVFVYIVTIIMILMIFIGVYDLLLGKSATNATVFMPYYLLILTTFGIWKLFTLQSFE